eukprot:GFUD01020957.1.p1 GENE.GFUD01020957.1~~GFUD01020957.1.p1  ORF type:complete len:115 (-),score=1.49 GFUD01020957.1:31-375(-)
MFTCSCDNCPLIERIMTVIVFSCSFVVSMNYYHVVLVGIFVLQTFTTQIAFNSWCIKMLSLNVSSTIWSVLIILSTHQTFPCRFLITWIHLGKVLFNITFVSVILVLGSFILKK